MGTTLANITKMVNYTDKASDWTLVPEHKQMDHCTWDSMKTGNKPLASTSTSLKAARFGWGSSSELRMAIQKDRE